MQWTSVKLSRNARVGLRILAGTAVIGLAYQNCGHLQSVTYASAKADLINNASILGGGTRVPVVTEPGGNPRPSDGDPGQLTGTTSTPVNTGTTSTPVNTGTTGIPIVTMPAPPTEMPVEMYCSSNGALTIGDILQNSPNSLIYAITDLSGNQVCQWTDPGARDSLLNTSKVVIEDFLGKCPKLTSGTYIATLKTAPSRQSLLMELSNDDSQSDSAFVGAPLRATITVNPDRSVTMVDNDIAPCAGMWGRLYAQIYGPDYLPICIREYGVLSAKILWSVTNAVRCDYGTSPLIVQLGAQVEPIWLTKPLEGIRFDIAGQNSKPPHAPKLISWLTEESAPTNYFIVLPDEGGEVRGIDQMFGDNTLGPDHLTPATAKDMNPRNGYEALRKWDGRTVDGTIDPLAKDGFITEKDWAFDRLRLWADKNRDGVAQREELTTLREHDVKSIDLTYDAGWLETDAWGNQTRMKSVVTTTDDKMHLLYDLWFRAL